MSCFQARTREEATRNFINMAKHRYSVGSNEPVIHNAAGEKQRHTLGNKETLSEGNNNNSNNNIFIFIAPNPHVVQCAPHAVNAVFHRVCITTWRSGSAGVMLHAMSRCFGHKMAYLSVDDIGPNYEQITLYLLLALKSKR